MAYRYGEESPWHVLREYVSWWQVPVKLMAVQKYSCFKLATSVFGDLWGGTYTASCPLFEATGTDLGGGRGERAGEGAAGGEKGEGEPAEEGCIWEVHSGSVQAG